MITALQFQKLLYDHPMYQCISADENDINVLVYGWNETAATFLDQALIAGQMAEHRINITVCAPDPDACWLSCLETRPALPEFVCVTTMEALDEPQPDDLATLRFAGEIEPDALDDFLMTSIFRSATERCHYLFICTGDDEKNARIRDLCRETACHKQAWGASALIASVAQDRILVHSAEGEMASIGPVVDVTDDLDALAFRVHLLWANQRSSSDFAGEWRAFHDPQRSYDRLSSRAFALSLPYKLWSAGISERDPDLAARAFQAQLDRDKDRSFFNRMAQMEHRRWVMEKITQGYTGVYTRGDTSAFEAFVRAGSMRLPGKNVCILRSRAEAPLCSEYYQANDHAAWDRPDARDDQLDDLDRMSLDLHRFMRSRADEIRAAHYPDDPNGPVLRLAALISEDLLPLQSEYKRFCFCLHAILDGSGVYARQISQYAEDLTNAFDRHAPGQAADARACVKEIVHHLFPVVEAAQYRNYKEYDDVLISGIPFILAYRTFPSLAMPFNAAVLRADVNDRIFTNLASPMVLKPGKVLYLFQPPVNVNPAVLRQMVTACAEFLKKNRIPCRLHFAVSLPEGFPDKKRGDLLKYFTALRDQDLLAGFVMDDTTPPIEFFSAQMAEHGIECYDGSCQLFASMLDNMSWTARMSAGFAYFELNSKTKKITANDKGAWLTYIADRSCLRIDDMFGLMHAENRDHHYPDVMDLVLTDARDGSTEPLYKRLWHIYTGGKNNSISARSVSLWNQLCDALGEDNTRIKGAGSLAGGRVSFARLVNTPSSASRAELRQQRYIIDPSEIAALLREIASIRTPDGRAFLTLEYDSAGRLDALTDISGALVTALGSAGTILEIYSFFSALETGYFDDVACSYTFIWGDQNTPDSRRKNEIDLVLTKGFRSIIVECKATSVLTQDYYHKLNTMADLFGVNARKVLIANTYSGNVQDYREQIARGDLMDVTTIHNSSLMSLGQQLVNQMLRP